MLDETDMENQMQSRNPAMCAQSADLWQGGPEYI
jgi:hypothetical protein